MSGFVKRTKTSNPAGGINPASQPNVGQYGWSSFDAANVNQLIEYVRIAKSAAESASNDALYIKTQLGNIDATVLYFEKLYNDIKPIADQIFPIYEEIKRIRDRVDVQYEDILRINALIVVLHDDMIKLLEEARALRDETRVYKDSAKLSETNATDAMNKSIDIYEELKKGQVYRGSWNPNSGSYPDHKNTNSVWDVILNPGQEDTGFVFDSKRWYVGDRLIYVREENKYEQLASGTSVKSVNGKTGAVILKAVDVEALPIAGGTLTGGLNINAGELNLKSAIISTNPTDDYKTRIIPTGGIGYFQGGHATNDNDQKIAFSGYIGKNLTSAVFRMKKGTSPVIQWDADTYALYHSGNKPTPGDINAVSRQGDTMTGLLTNTIGITSLGSIKYDHQATGRGISLSANAAGYSEIVPRVGGVEAWSDGLRHYGGRDWRVSTDRIYHQGFKPSAADLGALPATGGHIAGDLGISGKLAVDAGIGVYFTKRIGNFTDAKSGLILFAPNAVSGSRFNSRGFSGRVTTTRGSSSSNETTHHVDCIIRSVYNTNTTRLLDQFTNRGDTQLARIVVTVHEGQEWLALYYPSESGRTVSLQGVMYGSDPIIISDATGYNVVDLVTEQDLVRVGRSVRTLNVNGTGSSEGYRFNGKVAIGGTNDGWLRFNPNNHFTSGIYSGDGVFRHEGEYQLKNWDTATARPIRIATPSDEQYIMSTPGHAALNIKHPSSSNAARLINSYDESGKVRSSLSIRSDSVGGFNFMTSGSTSDANRVSIHTGNVFAFGSQNTGNDALTKLSWTEGRYLKKAGDTMTGNLSTNKKITINDAYGVDSQFEAVHGNIKAIYRVSNGDAILGTQVGNDWKGYIKVGPSGFTFNDTLERKVYHEGFKPKASDVGAVTGSTANRTPVTADGDVWQKIGTATMPQSASTVRIEITGGNGFNAATNPTEQTAFTQIVIRSGNNNPKGLNLIGYELGGKLGIADGLAWKNTSGDVYEIYAKTRNYGNAGLIWNGYASSNASFVFNDVPASLGATMPAGATAGFMSQVYSTLNPPTVDQLDAVKRTGDTMTGTLNLNAPYALTIANSNNYISGNSNTIYIANKNTGGKVILEGAVTPIARVGSADFNIYHQGFKPSASDVGAPVLNSSTKAIELQSPDAGITGGMTRTRADGAGQVSWLSATRDSGSLSIGAHSSRGPVYHDGGQIRDIYHTGRKPTIDEVLDGDSSVSMYKTVTLPKPAGVVDGKYYPIVITNTLNYPGLYISTRSSGGSDPMNNCSFNGSVRSGGWSDKGSAVEGQFIGYSSDERGIHSIIGGSEVENVYAVYVEARAFPLDIRISSKGNVYCTGNDISNGTAVFKAGVTPSDTDGNVFGTKVRILTTFNKGNSYYTNGTVTGNIQSSGSVTANNWMQVKDSPNPGAFLHKRAGAPGFGMMGQSASGEALLGTGGDPASYQSYLKVAPTKLLYSNNGASESRIYHEGFKPDAVDIGAVPTSRRVNGKALTGDITLTAAEMNALPLTGGTLTGVLNVPTNFQVNSVDVIGVSADVARFGNGTRTLKFHTNSDNLAVTVSGSDRRIYHEGFKPTAAGVGALPITGGTVTGTITATALSSEKIDMGPFTVQRTGNRLQFLV